MGATCMRGLLVLAKDFEDLVRVTVVWGFQTLQTPGIEGRCFVCGGSGMQLLALCAFFIF